MRIACEKCGTAYEVDATHIPVSGMSMKCTVCFHSFTILPPGNTEGVGIDYLPDSSSGEMQLTNDPTDIPSAPAGYVDPTNFGSNQADLPGLPSQRPDNNFADLPGLRGAQQRSDFADLPGLPRQPPPGGLPGVPAGIPPRPAPGGLPGAGGIPPRPAPGGLPDLADLPGLPARGAPQPFQDLPGLPQRPAPGGGGFAPPPPPPQPPQQSIGITPGVGQELPDLADLPGLPGGGGVPELADLPGLTGNAQPSNLPGLTSQPQQRAAGLNYGELSFDDGGQDDLALGGDDISLETADLPGPVGNQGYANLPGPVGNQGYANLPGPVGAPGFADLPRPVGGPGGLADLPAPASGGIDLPAPTGGIGLPAPAGISDLPAPSGGIGLPAPSGGIDLPAPSGGIDLPAPSGGIDLPMPSSNIDLPAPSGGIDLPMPSESGLPGGVIDLPGPRQDGMGGFEADLVAPKPGDEEIIRFEAPEGGEVVTFDDVDEVEPEPGYDAPVDIREKGRLPSKGVLIGIGGGVVTVVVAVVLAIVFIGGKKGPSKSEKLIAEAQKLFPLDTHVGYRDAASAFGEAARALEAGNKKKTLALAFQSQALSASAARFGLRNKIGDARGAIEPLAKEKEPPPELIVARGLLQLAAGKLKAAEDALAAASKARPQDSRASLYLGWVYLAQRQLGKAKTAFKRALAADDKLVAASFGLARVEAVGKRSAAALALIKKVLALSPAHGDALVLQAQLAIDADRVEEADKLVTRLINMDKARRLARLTQSRLFVVRGQLAAKHGETNAAREHFQQALKLNARNLEAQLGAGKLLLAAKRYKEAGDHFRSAQTIDPRHTQAGMLLANTMFLLGKPNAARDALTMILKREPKNPHVRVVLGRVEESVGALKTASKQYRQAIAIDPKFFEGYRSLSKLLLKQKKPDQAFEILKVAGEKLPKDPRVSNAIGEVHLLIREYKQARMRFEDALATDGKFNLALFNLATTLKEQGKLETALKKYQALETRDRDFPGLSAAFGALYVLDKKPKEAAAAYDKALAGGIPSLQLRLAAGHAYVLAGLWDKALLQANETLREDPSLADARALRAEARALEGDLGEALVEIQRAISRQKKARYFVIHAKILERLRRLADAVEAYRQALKLQPKRIELRLHRARLQVRGGAVRDALKELNRIVKEEPKMAEAHLYRGLALADLGKEAEAIAAYQRAVAIKPDLGEAHFKLAQTYNDRNKPALAIKHAIEAAKHGIKGKRWWSEAQFLLGTLAEKRNQKDVAIAAFKKFLEIAPKGDSSRPLAIKGLKRLGGWKPPSD